MDVLSSMSIFCRVVEAGSFTAIATETASTQPTISKHIAALEQRLETKLLNRSTRQLKLTEAGEKYYKHCLRILDDLSESEAGIKQGQIEPTGTLRITTPVMFGRYFIAPILQEFLQLYPEVSIELIMDDSHIDIIKEGIDLAIRAGTMSDSNLIATKLGTCPPQAMVASTEYLHKFGEPNNLGELKNHQCLLHSIVLPGNLWEFNGPNGLESVKIVSRFVTNNRDTINDAAIAGMGIAITHLWPNADNMRQGKLKRVLAKYEPTPVDFSVLYPERHFVPQKVRRLIEYLRSYFENTDKFRALVEKIN